MRPKFVSQYKIHKVEVNEKAAMRSFHLIFVREAVDCGWAKVKGRAAKIEKRQQERLAHIEAAASELHAPVASACEAYLLSSRTKVESRSLPELLDDIKVAAGKAADAIDILAAQLLRQYLELEERDVKSMDATRYFLLHSLGFALNASFIDIVKSDVFSEFVSPGPVIRASGVELEHGLAGLRWLSRAADKRLKEYRSESLPTSLGNAPVVTPRLGDYANREEDDFISDLAVLFDSHVGKVTCHRGNRASHGTPSGFVRFVNRIFDEVKVIAGARGISMPKQERSPDKIHAALKRTGTAAHLSARCGAV
ncbi:hypothetical protein M8312_13115 [Sphingomonas sp. KRR8]|uniref:hypothetical protein n=1 Tax=Sphingomonas sp. KRR8 TaxID=2942996 RepID=UPI0020211EBA|nr:hypothetical protein [Sphingomonas sp. KRR8]URD60699.1 hypothetical protein M8312_13115 [Sphingomonas sp. KRR8]